MKAFGEKFVSACCPHLVASEISAVYGHIHDTFTSLDLVHAADVRTIARQLFPYVQEQSKTSTDDRMRIQEAIAKLASADRWLSKIRNSSDDVAIARRDIGMIADRLQGVDQ